MLSNPNQTDELPFINMTPMVDVILCLLVFFMAATRLYDWDDSEFTVKTPEVDKAAPATAAPQDIVLSIQQPGQVRMGNSTLNLRQLATALQQARARYPDQGVVIKADANLPYQNLAEVLSACDEAGLANVRLPVRSRAGGDANSSPSSP